MVVLKRFLQDYNEDQGVKGELTAVLDWNVPSLYRRDETEDGDKIKHCLQFFLVENMTYDLNEFSTAISSS